MEEVGGNFAKSRKIHHSYFEEIWDVGLQVHGYSDGCKFEEAEGICFRFWFDWSHHVLPIDWISDVFDVHQTRYMLCCVHSQPVYGWSKADSLGYCKTCFQINTWHCGIWTKICFRMWFDIARIFLFKLGRMCCRQEEYFQMLLQFRFCSNSSV